ncbi:MAG: amidohydrolase [Betaproteobacteria bacterium RIFCSPLOWO2_02_FULL_65_24]|nr:MAG: amidohydrolase [Betaproteobacteria bacterium RIFCSPLOWO2_02_FULL_65_24]OGA87350.1 MAG: amidohydrolase [Betaproteobacteria bacterium RIFCSPLOWO2_12_FULL_66_14]
MLRRIAVEEAFVTADIAAQWSRVLSGRFVEPGFKAMGNSILGDNPGTKRVHERLIDLDAGRLAHMDATGIDMQVISMTSPGVQVFDAVTATSLSAQANDVLAQAVRRHPSRFAGLATVAPQYPEGAARELERAVNQLGLKGAIINSHTMGEYLDDPKYWPLLEAAESLRTPIYLHPREPAPSMVGPYLDYGLYWAGWGFAAETGLHAMRLIMGGVFERFPKLKIILGHMGEGMPFWLQRIDNRYQLGVKIGAHGKLQRLPSEYFLENFVISTSGVMHNSALQLSIDVLGTERIMFAADYPYESVEDGVKFLDNAPISEADRRRIYSGNAEALFGLSR